MKAFISRPDYKVTIFQGMVTASPKMHQFFELVKKVAASEASVLIRGETGTGKELAARAIHNLSLRKSHPFNAVNCAILTPELAASELFGHIKGSFTGASSDHKGYFEASDMGTLFLDEVAELPLSVQSRLLRVIQEHIVTPVGSTKSKKVNVRLLSATHRALRNEVKAKRFREDLMYRIRVIPLFLPRLMERDNDLDVLIWRFLEEFNDKGTRHIDKITKDAYEAMHDYLWPGNIRELRNNIEHAYIMGDGEYLKLEDLPPELRGLAPTTTGDDELEYDESMYFDLDKEERQRILDALRKAKGRKSEAAEILGMSRSTLWRKGKMLNIF